MRLRIRRRIDNEFVESKIVKPIISTLPSLTDGWRFNFRKHAQKSSFQCYALVCDESPIVVEGCLIFQLKDASEPYMAYLEIAPQNKGADRRFEDVAGCLIAFASRLSFIHGKGHFKGWLAFDVMEQTDEDKLKLMSVYCKKYGALRWGETGMVIAPEAGERLIDTFLNQRL